MNLLAATTRYYLVLTAGLFVLAGGLLYQGLHWALRHEANEQLVNERLALQRRAQSGRPLPTDLLFAHQLSRSRQPRRLGFPTRCCSTSASWCPTGSSRFGWPRGRATSG